MLKRLFSLTILASLFTLSAFGQQNTTFELSGRILTEDGPAAYANIGIPGTTFGTLADEQGQFVLALPAGTYRLRISLLGYLDQEKDIEITNDLELPSIELITSAIGLDEVVVTGSMRATHLSDSPIKVEVINGKQVEAYMPSAASSIVEAVQLVNGVQEVVACGVCFTNSISINGLPGPYTAVLLDGTPMYGNLASVYGLNGLPTQIIEQIEVIKGPSSTLYGSEAVAGVINIITKDPGDQPLLSVDVMGTTHAETFANIAVAPKLGKAKGYIGLNYARLPEFQDFNEDGFGDAINLDRYSLFSKWEMPIGQEVRLSLAAKAFWEDRRNGVEAFLEDRNYEQLRGNDSIYGESIYTDRYELFGTIRFRPESGFKIDFSLSSHDQDSYYGADHYVATQQIAFANATWTRQWGKHYFLAGATQRYQFYDDNTVATVVGDRQYIPGVFVQDEWSKQAWTILAGARLDHYQAHGPILAPRLNIKAKASDWTTLRFNFGTGFRIVNLFTEDHAFVTGQRTVEVVEELQPERSYNGSLDLNHIFVWGNTQGSIDVEGFYTYFLNKIVPDYDTPGKIIYANTDGHAVSRGLSVTLNQQIGRDLSYQVGFNWQDVSQTEPNEDGVLERSPIEFAPQWSGVAMLTYQWRKPGLQISYTANITGPMQLPEVFDLDVNGEPVALPRPTTSRPFALQNIQIKKGLGSSWQLYAGIQNLGNYRQPWSPLVGFNDPNANPGFGNGFDTAYAYSPIHGREFFMGVRWDFDRKNQ